MKPSTLLCYISRSSGYPNIKERSSGWAINYSPSCANKFWTEDLLLVKRDFLLEFIRDHRELREVKWDYQIQVMQDEEFDIVK